MHLQVHLLVNLHGSRQLYQLEHQLLFLVSNPRQIPPPNLPAYRQPNLLFPRQFNPQEYLQLNRVSCHQVSRLQSHPALLLVLQAVHRLSSHPINRLRNHQPFQAASHRKIHLVNHQIDPATDHQACLPLYLLQDLLQLLVVIHLLNLLFNRRQHLQPSRLVAHPVSPVFYHLVSPVYYQQLLQLDFRLCNHPQLRHVNRQVHQLSNLLENPLQNHQVSQLRRRLASHLLPHLVYQQQYHRQFRAILRRSSHLVHHQEFQLVFRQLGLLMNPVQNRRRTQAMFHQATRRFIQLAHPQRIRARIPRQGHLSSHLDSLQAVHPIPLLRRPRIFQVVCQQ